jgi:DNA gyrase inhibitor GyrI
VTELDVRIERLGPMRVAATRAISRTPERDAWDRLRSWAEPRGLLADLEEHPVYGFNNPNPSPEREDYGYEFWIRVDPDTEAEGEIEVKDFPGGLYAVTTCKLLGDPRGSVPEIWLELLEWVKGSEYKWRETHELEQSHDPLGVEEDVVLSLFLPVEESHGSSG